MLGQFLCDARVLVCICDDGDIFVVFRGGADHAWAADIYVFDSVFACAAWLRDGLLEWVEIDAHEVDGFDGVGLHCLHVRRVVAAGEQAAVDFGVQGFDATIHDFWEAGDGVDGRDGDAVFLEEVCGAACRDDFDVERMKRLSEGQEA